VTGGTASSTTRTGWIATLFAVSTVGLALTACNSGPPSATATTTSSAQPSSAAPTTPASPADQAKQAALAAYTGMWQDFVVAGTTSDWQSASLGQHATGIALTNMTKSLFADHTNGLVTKGEPTFTPTVTSADPSEDPTKIVITDCSDGVHWLKYKAANGQLANDTPGGRHLINAIVEKQSDGSWKVSEYGVHEAATC
jgi:hypothetical protein